MQQANTRPCSFRHSLNSAFKFTSCLPAWTQTPVPFGKQTPSAVAEEVGDCEVCSRICNGVFKVSASIPFSKAVSSNSTSGPGMHNDAVQFHADYRASTLPTTLGKVSAIAEHHRHPFLAAPNPAVQVNPGSKQEKPDQMWLHSRSRFVNPVATAPVACSIVSSSPAATEATTSGNWQCDVCGKRFALSSVLKSHRHIHSGVRPHVCEICKKHFLRSGDLKKHRRFHTGERPFHCDVCGKRFHQSGHLKNHLRIHSGERPFSCWMCDRSFRQSCNLKRHLKTHSTIRQQ